MTPQRPAPNAHRPWTSAQDAELRALWDEGLGITRIAARLGRTRFAVYFRAGCVLGLPRGVPAGFERLSVAAKRAGVDPVTLCRILRWARKKVRRTLSQPLPRHWHRLMVDPLDVDEALGAWARTEPVETAARRLGIDGARLRARLRKLGYKPARAGRGRAWRITPEQLAAANAIGRWRARPSSIARAA